MIVGVSKIAAALGRWAMVMETRMAESEKTNILQKREIDQLRSEVADLKGLLIL